MVDPVEAIVDFLKADSSVSAQVATRVFGAELPRTENTSMPRKAVVVKPAGGPGGFGYMEVARIRLDVDCYGATPKDGWTVHLAVRTALKELRREISNGVLVHSVDVSADGVPARDPETDWPVTLASYIALVAEVAAA